MSCTLLLQIDLPCGIYCTEQKGETIMADRIKTCITDWRTTEQARRQAHNVARLSCPRLGRIQKPASSFAAKKFTIDQIKDSLQS